MGYVAIGFCGYLLLLVLIDVQAVSPTVGLKELLDEDDEEKEGGRKGLKDPAEYREGVTSDPVADDEVGVDPTFNVAGLKLIRKESELLKFANSRKGVLAVMISTAEPEAEAAGDDDELLTSSKTLPFL